MSLQSDNITLKTNCWRLTETTLSVSTYGSLNRSGWCDYIASLWRNQLLKRLLASVPSVNKRHSTLYDMDLKYLSFYNFYRAESWHNGGWFWPKLLMVNEDLGFNSKSEFSIVCLWSLEVRGGNSHYLPKGKEDLCSKCSIVSVLPNVLSIYLTLLSLTIFILLLTKHYPILSVSDCPSLRALSLTIFILLLFY
jgi:hypothetical protein